VPRSCLSCRTSTEGLAHCAFAEGLVFVGPLGSRLRRSNFRDLWLAALNDAGIDGCICMILRHTRNTMAAATGAGSRD
jgi:hypothetical protein